MGSTAHWTLTYMTTSTLQTNCYNSVNVSFAIKEPQMELLDLQSVYLQRYEVLKIQRYEVCIFAVSWDQLHIGH